MAALQAERKLLDSLITTLEGPPGNAAQAGARPFACHSKPLCRRGSSHERPHRALVASKPGGPLTALLVSPDGRDRGTLQPIFDREQWKLHSAETVVAALDLLTKRRIPVIVSERDLPPYDWRWLFEKTRNLPHQPLLVVASSLADEYLWSEVLNLGGHDVLAKPFRESEVFHVLSHAWNRRRFATQPALGVAETGLNYSSPL
jgi:CheY-like chemotaxis protein